MTSFFESAAPSFVMLLLKATIWLALTCLAAFVLRRGSAAQRHMAWTAGLVGLLLLPLLSLVIPGWSLPFSLSESLPTQEQRAQLTPTVPLPEREADQLIGMLTTKPAELTETVGGPTPPREVSRYQIPRVVSVQVPVTPTPVNAPPTGTVGFSIAAWFFAAWAFGMALCLSWILLGSFMLLHLRRRSELVTCGELFNLVNGIAREMGVRPVRLLLGTGRVIPSTWGLFRPTILLPREAEGWTFVRLRLVLLHELGHAVRRDCFTQLLGLVARALFWFHPLVWLAVRRQRFEQEQACDDLVLSHGESPVEYAEHLLAITANLPAHVFASPVALGMARSSVLGRRVVALLDGKRNRRICNISCVMFCAFPLMLLLSLLASATQGAAAKAPEARPHRIHFAGEKKDAPLELAGKEADGENIDTEALIQEIRRKLKETYVGPIDEKKLNDAVLKGLLESLKDPYTDYLPPMDLKLFEGMSGGSFAGIGAQLRIEGDRIIVVTPIANSPALKAGLRPGDVIESVDGTALRGIPLDKAVQKILGPKGKQVKLRVIHPDGVVEDLAVTRDLVSVGTVEGFRRDADGRWIYWLDPDRKIAYVHIMRFGPATSTDLRGVLDMLDKDGLKGLVLDLRFCPGGFLNQALATCQLFLAKGNIVSTRGSTKEEQKFDADGTAPWPDLPLVVLVNEATASAAEIVSGALQENKRAVLVGSRTFGKGSVQAVVKLDAGGALKVTTAYHFLPSGRNIQKRPGAKLWGVDPADGYFVLVTQEQSEALKRDHTRRGLLGFKKDEAPRFPERLTPRLIETEHHDPQLAAGLKTLTARLTGGEFVPVGKNTRDVEDQLLRLDELQQRRDQLMQNLKKLEEEIRELQKAK